MMFWGHRSPSQYYYLARDGARCAIIVTINIILSFSTLEGFTVTHILTIVQMLIYITLYVIHLAYPVICKKNDVGYMVYSLNMLLIPGVYGLQMSLKLVNFQNSSCPSPPTTLSMSGLFLHLCHVMSLNIPPSPPPCKSYQ